MNTFEIIVYAKSDGTEPVTDFIYSLSSKMQAKLLHEIDILSEYGNELREPYSKHLDDGIFELRVKSGSDISRVLYFFIIGKKIILTNGFIKKTQKTPSSEIKLAKQYRSDYLSREEKWLWETLMI